jgi:saccharopine dehydrogenase (NAD+, L-lysine-forming)
MKIGILKETKSNPDDRVALSPHQCKVVMRKFPQIQIVVQPSNNRCFTNNEYQEAGIVMQDSLEDCNILLGIKEVAIDKLLDGKTYLMFSHTKKKQDHNKKLLQAIIAKKITLIDYECLTYADRQRILGFGFFAGIVGAHNGLLTYGKKTSTFNLPPVHRFKDFREVIRHYFEVQLPPIKIIATGSGRVSTGIVETMNMFDIKKVMNEEFLNKNYEYPVYTELTAEDLYKNKETNIYNRAAFRKDPTQFRCDFAEFYKKADLLLNGVYWEQGIPPFFTLDEMKQADFKIKVIADITCDENGSIPCNLGATTIQNPTYGYDPISGQQTAPYLQNTVDIMAVDNLPNELPRDASDFFGVQLTKYVIPEFFKLQTGILERATIASNGQLTSTYAYLQDYANN